jgi:hypothetical protein
VRDADLSDDAGHWRGSDRLDALWVLGLLAVGTAAAVIARWAWGWSN